MSCDDDREHLDDEYRRVREILGEWAAAAAPPPEIEAALLARVRELRPAPARPAWRRAAAAALAAAAMLGAWLWNRDSAPPAAARIESQPEATPFLPIERGRPTLELTGGRVVRVILPPEAPGWFGLPADPREERGWEADLLLSDDGVAQAVRFLYASDTR